MAGIAVCLAPEQVVAGHLQRRHRIVALQKRVELRGECAHCRRRFEKGNRLRPMVIVRVRTSAIIRTQVNWLRVRGKDCSSTRSTAYFFTVRWPSDCERPAAPYCLKKWPVDRLG